MLLLVLLGVLAGVVAGLSPCVLPVLPVVFFSGTGRSTAADRAGVRRSSAVAAGVAVGFAALTLLGSVVLGALGLPADVLRWAGLVVLVVVGAGLLLPGLEELLQRPFRRVPVLRSLPARSSGNGFVLGLAVGTLYVPCAGPVLAAISIAGSSRQFGSGVVVLTIAFAVGAAAPLFVVALAGAGAGRRIAGLRRGGRSVRVAGGVLVIVVAVALSFNLTDGVQRLVPAYTQALQAGVEQNPVAQRALAGLRPSPAASPVGPVATPAPPPAAAALGPVTRCASHAQVLANCGPAPAFAGISAWLNTRGGAPVVLSALRGKVVLVNFWTFSCINCQRALPAVRSWYLRYHASGLEVVGVHTPESAYEHDLANVRAAVSDDGISYPVALDNSSSTWRAYGNSYWPAEYLVDARGIQRHVVFGEGGYADSEALIRALLRAADPTVQPPPPVDPSVAAG